MNNKKIQNERNDFHGKMIFSIITFFYILSFELWYDSYSEDDRGVQLVVAETGGDLHLHQGELKQYLRSYETCVTVNKEVEQILFWDIRFFYDSSYYDEIQI